MSQESEEVVDVLIAARHVCSCLWVAGLQRNGGMRSDVKKHIAYRKALDAGLTFRPLTETIHDTLVWDRAHPGTVVQSGSITPQQEADLLHAWHMHIHE